MLDTLRRSIDADREAMASFLAELIRHPTENPPGRGYAACLEAIGAKLGELGLDHRLDRVPGGDRDPEHPRHWLRAEWGKGRRAVYFHGHVDVVPAFDAAQFEPRVTAAPFSEEDPPT